MSSVYIVIIAVDMGGGEARTRPGGESGELTEGLEVFDGHKLGLFVVNGV